MRMARFTPLCQHFLQLALSILLGAWHLFSPNQHSYSPSPFASSTSSMVILASPCPHFKLQCFSHNMPIIPPQHMPVLSHSIRLCHLNLSTCLLFPSIPTSPLGSLSSFAPSVFYHTLLSPLRFRSFSKLPSHFPSNTMCHSHITLPILNDSDKAFLSSFKQKPF